jgi:diguanylate cyclase (GGDEF)-like protein
MESRAPVAAFTAAVTEAAGGIASASTARRSLRLGFGAVAVVNLGGLLLVLLTGWPGLLVAVAAVVVAAVLATRFSLRQVGGAIGGLRSDLEGMTAELDRAHLDARLDPLTGLANQRAFREELARQVAHAHDAGRPLALAILDVDDLELVNDAGGHDAGDRLLAGVGRLVRAASRAADRTFRVGGDEFALLLPNTTAEEAYGLVRRLLAQAAGGHPTLRDVPRFSFSAGISTCPAPSPDGHRLAHHAEAALYWAKRHGRTEVQVFDPTRHGTVGDERSAEELAAAVSRVAATRALRPVYQPIVSLATGHAVGFEGLVRPSPQSGFVDAHSLFTAAEIADRIVELDLAAVETIAARTAGLVPGTYLGLNLSPRTIEAQQFNVSDIIRIVRRHGLVPDQIVLELTERETIEDLARLKANLGRVRAAGMRVAADDVGAGNAGLRLLSEVAFDIVKIDLSLVQKGVLQDSSLNVLRGLREMAQRSGAVVVAEGVETPEQLVVLRRLGITAAQGYLLGRPSERATASPVDLDLIASMSNLDQGSVAP